MLRHLLLRFLCFFSLNYLIELVLKKLAIKSVVKKSSHKKKSIKILALSSEKFRDDLEILDKTRNIKVYKISDKWLSLFYVIFYGRKKIEKRIQKLYSVVSCNNFREKQKKYHNFLINILSRLQKHFEFDFLISADVRYSSNIDWGIVSEKINIPYVIFHRENLYACKKLYELVVNRHSKWGSFPGSMIIVHNNITKKMFLESQFINDPSKIVVNGCLRMDVLKKKIKEKKYI